MLEEIVAIQRKHGIIGRERELEKALMAVHTCKHILFEGPVGVGKTVLAMSVANHFKRRFYRVDGDERYTEHKLVGWFDPSSVIAKGYSWASFIPGPLVLSMKEGSFLFINELNRMPEGTQNVLLPAMDERQIIIPKTGTVEAKPGFLIVATQNPEEFVGTSRVSEALRDRFMWIPLEYQSEDDEAKIVRKETGINDDHVVLTAVKITRKTREDPHIRRGASVRGAIDLSSLIHMQLPERFVRDVEVWVKSSIMALGTKIELNDRTNKTVAEVIRPMVLSVLEDQLGKKKVL